MGKGESCIDNGVSGVKHREFMERAIELSRLSMENGGGPFGAVIVKDGKIIGEASNSVTLHNDPTAHAEVEAIRNACSRLETYELDGAVIYTSCEPCPMCLGAIYWAHIRKIYYACDRKDAAEAGFDDSFIYDQIDLTPSSRSIPLEQLLHSAGRKVFDSWITKEDKVPY